MRARNSTIAVIGATGYVGGRLVPRLLDAGFAVRCLAREPRKLDARPWRDDPRVEVVACDLTDQREATDALRGCSAVYYLIDAVLGGHGGSGSQDRELARATARAAAEARVERIVYLGTLGDRRVGHDDYVWSRRDVEEALSSTGVPLTSLRVAPIIGSGSASFEALRYLVERLPVMVTPRWVDAECQPVAIRDVLHWLVTCLETPATTGRVLEVGGPEVMTYRELMQRTAAVLGLGPRLVFGVPFLTPRLSSAWVSLITPITYRVARPLVDSLCNRLVVEDDALRQLMPHEPLRVHEAVQLALERTEAGQVTTRWSAAGPIPGDPDWSGGQVFVDERSVEIDARPTEVFDAVCKVGGGHGWYAGDFLWRLRGWMDQCVGGPGLRRGRRDPENVEFGEALDFWRVVGIERPQSLLLHAEMKVPGTARLGFEVEELETNRSRLTMTARFRPRGLFGLLYWYAVVPLHGFVFSGMLGGMKRAAEQAFRRNAAVEDVPAVRRAS